MADAIALEGLTKRYGARVAVDGVSFTVGPGEIVGLLGPNGAGKSTTLAILATLLPFDDGAVRVAGHALPGAAAAARRVLGLVPQDVALYPSLTAHENLRFFARTHGLHRRAATEATTRVLVLVGLADRADEAVSRFSVGMRRRLNLACGLLQRPAVLLLDEPTVGVDPQSRLRVFEVARELTAAGTAILWSTHMMEEAEHLCDRVVLLDGGRMVAEGTAAALVARTGMTPRLAIRTARALPAGWLDALPGVRLLPGEAPGATVVVPDLAAVPAVLTAAAGAGGAVVECSLHRPDLADAFLALTGNALRDEADGPG